MKKIFTIALATLGLAACASIPNPIAIETRDQVYVEAVGLTWSVDDADEKDENGDYAKGKADLMERMQIAVESAFQNSPSGAEAVSFEVDINFYTRVNAVTGNIIGGSNTVRADVTVRRDSDGEVLGIYEGVSGSYVPSGGVIGLLAQGMSNPDVVGIMANSFTSNLRRKFDSK